MESSVQSGTAGAVAPGWGQRESEGLLFKRCENAVDACEQALKELREHVKAARSHREKCSNLLAAAVAAVMALRELLGSKDIDVSKEKQLQQLCTRVQSAIDQGDTKVRVYGQMSGVSKLVAKVFSPNTYARFGEVITELNAVAKQAREVMELPSLPSPPRPSSAGTSTGLTPQASAATSIGAGIDIVPSEAAAARPTPPSSQTLTTGTPPSHRTLDMFMAKQSFMQRGNPVPVEALQRQRLYRGARGQAVTAMLYVPPAPHASPGSMGRMWYYVSKTFGGGLYVYDLSSQIKTEVEEAKQDHTVTCMHLDCSSGLLWTGHRKGYMRVWQENVVKPLCEPVQTFSSTVRVITTDERNRAWAGSDKGNVKRVALVDIQRGGQNVGGYTLLVQGQLKWAGPGRADLNTSAPAAPASEDSDEMVDNKHHTEPAHYGAVSSIVAALGLVCTAGGSSAFVCLRQWTYRGDFVSSVDLRSVGPANSMLLISPIVRVVSSERAPSVTMSSHHMIQSRVVQGEMPQIWQLLTGHNSGLIQVWAMLPGSGVLKPILRIGDRMAPIKGLVVCEQLGLVCSGHTDGRLLLRALPHIKSSQALTVTDSEKSLGHVKISFAELETSKSGTALLDGGLVGAITASNNATIVLWPEAVLRAAGTERSLHILPGCLHCFNSVELSHVAYEAQYQVELEAPSDQGYELAGPSASLSLIPGQSNTAASRQKSVFEDSTKDWRLEKEDLQFMKIIGEGAVGKVWLGRFQETDVAIKQLTSISQLSMGMADYLQEPAVQEPGPGGLSPEVMKTLEREVSIMIKIRHPNVILFMGVCLEPPAVVTEFCARGSLYDVLKQARFNPGISKQLDWGKRLNMAMDAAKGMHHLHSHKPAIIHRDLKSPNLLVDKHWRVKVTDFNLSRITEQAGPAVQSSLTANNPRWQAPEVVRGQGFTKASDVFAFGLIMWELITWEVPFKELSQFQIMMGLTQQHLRPEIPDQYASSALMPGGSFAQYQQYCALMQQCWADDPEQRPGFDQVIAELRSMLEQMAQKVRLGGSSAGPTRPAAQQNGGRGVGAPPPLALPAPPQEGAPAGTAAAGAAAGAAAAGAAAAAARRIHDSVASPTLRNQGGPSSRSNTPESDPSGQSASGAAYGAGGAAGAVGTSPRASPFDQPSPGATMPPSPFGSMPVGQQAPWQQQQVAAPPSCACGDAEAAAPSSAVAAASSAAPPATAASGATVLAANGPPPSPFDSGFVVPAAAVAAASGATVLAANGPPPSPFDGGFAAPAAAAAPAPAASGATVLAANGPPPSPFDGGFSVPAAAAAVLAANGPPPSPFDGGFAAPAAQPPAAASGATVLAANGPPPSPFGGFVAPAAAEPAATPAIGGALAPSAVLAANGPPPSPFGGVAMQAAAQPAAQPAQPPPATVGVSASVNASEEERSTLGHAATAAPDMQQPQQRQQPSKELSQQQQQQQRPLKGFASLDVPSLDDGSSGEDGSGQQQQKKVFKRSLTAPSKMMRKLRSFGRSGGAS